MDVLTASLSRHSGAPLLLVMSFDGVLAEYRSDPALVRVPASRLSLVKRLQQSADVVVAVMSGRALDDLRPRVPLDKGAFYIGLHGLEIVGPGVESIDRDAIDGYGDRMAAVVATLLQKVGHVPGLRLEHKGPIVALHTRDVDPQAVVWSRFQLLSAAADLVNSRSVRTIRGQHVLELMPNAGRSRVDAVMAVERCVEARFQRPVFTIYVGADWPDDDAAEIGGENHFAAVVGRRMPADYHLPSPAHVDGFLAQVIAARHGAVSR